MRLLTRRLVLRPFRLDDLEPFHAHVSRPEVSVPLGMGAPPRTLAQTRRRVRRLLAEARGTRPKRLQFAILARRGGAWLGACVLRWPHKGVGELGYSIAAEAWGRGYATEAVRALVALAFRRLGAHRVQATCWVRNAGSSKVLTKAGLRREGRLRGFLRHGDEVRDEYVYGMTRADWNAAR